MAGQFLVASKGVLKDRIAQSQVGSNIREKNPVWYYLTHLDHNKMPTFATSTFDSL